MLLTFEQQNSLVAQGLAKRSDNGYLSTFKYARKVMYDYLWNQHPELFECRGHTYNNITGELIIAAPRKTFNYLENGTWVDRLLCESVTAYKKYNGFMACAAYDKDKNPVISTTGSTKSQYVEWAENELPCSFITSATSLYEIVVPQDPHIVQEKETGAIFLGVRENTTGKFTPSLATLESCVETLQDVLELCKTDKGEGFMLYDAQGNCCKMKTEYYIGKKKLMRMNKQNIKQMWQYPNKVQQTLPIYWNGVVEYLLSSQNYSEWMEMTDQQRRKELEKFV